jgi:catechol 2,3-dioxygenase-like lactoylglutathione lyase family enzyme
MSETGQSHDARSPEVRIIPVLPVADVEQAAEFFREKLGFDIRQSASKWGWAIVSRNGAEIVLAPKEWPAGCEIRVEDVDRMFDELLGRGAEFESGPTNQEYGARDFAVRGPDGYQIAFSGPPKKYADAAPPSGLATDGDLNDSIPF